VLNIAKAESFGEYLASLGFYGAVVYLLFMGSLFVFNPKVVVEMVGLIANLIESMVSLPTFYRVVILQEISIVSPVLILQYYSGDLMKVALFVVTRSPWPFFAGAFLQLAIDTSLFITYVRLSFCAVMPDSEALLAGEDAETEEPKAEEGEKEEEVEVE
jgi:hypothetical protein